MYLSQIPLIETTRNSRSYAERPELPNPGHAYTARRKSRFALDSFVRLLRGSRYFANPRPCSGSVTVATLAMHACVHAGSRETVRGQPDGRRTFSTSRRQGSTLYIRRTVVLGRPALSGTCPSIQLRPTPDSSGISCSLNKLSSGPPKHQHPDEVRATRRKGCRDCMHRRDGLAAGEAKDTQTRT